MHKNVRSLVLCNTLDSAISPESFRDYLRELRAASRNRLPIAICILFYVITNGYERVYFTAMKMEMNKSRRYIKRVRIQSCELTIISKSHGIKTIAYIFTCTAMCVCVCVCMCVCVDIESPMYY